MKKQPNTVLLQCFTSEKPLRLSQFELIIAIFFLRLGKGCYCYKLAMHTSINCCDLIFARSYALAKFAEEIKSLVKHCSNTVISSFDQHMYM